MNSSDDRPQIQNGIKGTIKSPKIVSFKGKTGLVCISNGNQLQQGNNLKNTLQLLKIFHQIEKTAVCETGALKVFSIASTLVLDAGSDKRNQKYKQALTERWEKADLLAIWEEVQTARAEFIKKKGSRNLGELQAEAEHEQDYVLGLVIKAEQSYEKWLADNPYLTDKFKQENNIEIINWLTLMQDAKVVSEVSELIKLYSGDTEDRNVTVFKTAVDLSVNEILSRKSIKNLVPDSLIGKLSALYIIEETGMVKNWGDIEPNQNPRYNVFMYINKLNKAMYQVLNKHVWKEDEKGSGAKIENLQFRRINFKRPAHPLAEEFWHKLENNGIEVEQKVVRSNPQALNSPEEIYQSLVKQTKVLLYLFLHTIEAAYIPDFVVKLIQYINSNFEELEKILCELLPVSIINKSIIEEGEQAILECLKLKVLVSQQCDLTQPSQVVSNLILFGETYLKKVKLEKAASLKSTSNSSSVTLDSPMEAHSHSNNESYCKCSIM